MKSKQKGKGTIFSPKQEKPLPKKEKHEDQSNGWGNCPKCGSNDIKDESGFLISGFTCLACGFGELDGGCGP